MQPDATLNRSGRVFFGLLLVGIGGWLLLVQLGLLEGFPWALGPLALVIVGTAILLKNGRRGWPGGAWLIVLGLWLFISLQGLFGLGFHNSWPLLLVGLGVITLLRAFIPVEHHRGRCCEVPPVPAPGTAETRGGHHAT